MDIGMFYVAGLNMVGCLLNSNWMGAAGWFVAAILFFQKFIAKTKA